MTATITLQIADPRHKTLAQEISQQYGFELTATNQSNGFQLWLDDLGLQLFDRDAPKQGAIHVDFVAGANAHRRKFGGGKGQTIAKAAGLKAGFTPQVIDGTAGLGKDAFVLASLGCRVLLVERHPVVSALLADGLRRAFHNEEIGDWMQQRMILSPCSHISQLDPDDHQVDVVYLDPMYPHRAKSALVKKDMRTFQQLVGSDLDGDALLPFAQKLAKKRVVVKRPDYAPSMANVTPSLSFKTKKNRFDVYLSTASR